MISGRGLGHSGGTLDKLESIPGLDVGLSLERFREVLEKVGCALIGQTEEIAPADRKLYSLRDVTATVESIPLITASILSKKLAEGINGLVLDVKVGSGAYMKEEQPARELASSLVGITTSVGKRVVALLTDMDQPLGTHVGNALEVKESVEVLRGEGPADLRELCMILTAHMLLLGKIVSGIEEGKRKAAHLIASGAGLEKLIEMVKLQGGDPRCVENTSRLARASNEKVVSASRGGYVARIDTEAVGMTAMWLGAGRETIKDTIDPAVGLVVHRKIGEQVSKGEPLLTLHYNDVSRLEEAERLVGGAYEIGDGRPPARRMVRAVLGNEGVGS
jgi:pyrimidine-nucleoside phosphorylase